MAANRIEYMCSHCGKRETRYASQGRPQPGNRKYSKLKKVYYLISAIRKNDIQRYIICSIC